MSGKNRVLVIGLDSAPLPWVERWVGAGKMPNLGRLIKSGATGTLCSVNPPLSPAAWSSFTTGLLPDRHGVYDHIYRRPGTYDIAPTNRLRRGGTSLWKMISDSGGTVGVINVPETFPPEQVNGFLISGMDTPSDDSEFAYPDGLKAELQQAVGGYQVFGPRSKENLDRSIAGMYQTIPMRCRAASYLWGKYNPDFMILVFMETDVIQHKTWKYMDQGHPQYTQEGNKRYGTAIPDIYSLVDREIKPLLDQVDDQTTVIIMSDHGAGPLNAFLYLNNWLVHNEFLHFKSDAKTRAKRALFEMGLTPENIFDTLAALRLGMVDGSINRIKNTMASQGKTTLAQQVFLSWTDIDWSQTRAYTLGGNSLGFYVNVKGREPQGSVQPGAEYERVRDEIISCLKGWRDPATGMPIVDRAMRREEMYNGEFTDRAPDVVFTARNEAYVGFGGHEFANHGLLRPSKLFNGHHRLDGMVTLWGRNIRENVRLDAHNIVDLAPTIMHLLGHNVPQGLDGHVIQQALAPDFLIERPVEMPTGIPVEIPNAASRVPAMSEETYSTDEEEEVMGRLKDLGYV